MRDHSPHDFHDLFSPFTCFTARFIIKFSPTE
jgi:hypothetical protein